MLIRIKLCLKLIVSGHGHLHLALVLGQAILVLLVDGSRRWPVEVLAILRAHLPVLSLLIVKCLLASCEHIRVNLLETFGSLDTLGKVI